MRDYAKVVPTFWTGDTGKAIRRKGPDAIVVALYLMTSPTSNMLGLYYQPILYMAHETGLGVERASEGLRLCVETGFCAYDQETEFVFVRHMAAYQIDKQLKASDNRCKGIQREYDSLPENPFLDEFFVRYGGPFHMTSARGREGASESLRSQEQEQEQEQEKENSSSTAAPSTDLLGGKTTTDIAAKRAERISTITADAIAAYNRILGKPTGLLRAVRTAVGIDTRRDQVSRCLKTASEICQDLFGDSRVTPEFWTAYFESASADDFHSGRGPYTGAHENWRPDFEFLTRKKVMLKLFERAVSDEDVEEAA